MSGATLVRLQRPLPVMASLRPGRCIFSSTSTEAPARAAWPAAISPAGPPPMTSRRLAPADSVGAERGWAEEVVMTGYYYTMAGKKTSTSAVAVRRAKAPLAAP